MIYFDYQDDLETFNSLMESIDPVVLLESETQEGDNPKSTGDETKPAENSQSGNVEPPAEETTKAEKAKKKQMKETGSLVSSAMQHAIMGKTEDSDNIRKLLFQAAYQTTGNKPNAFAIPNDKGMTIINDPGATDFFKQGKKKIVVNFSALIYQCTTKTYLKHLCVATNWDEEIGSTTNGFHKAIIKALEKLAGIISSGIYGIDEQPSKEKKKNDKNEQDNPNDKVNKQEPPNDEEPKKEEPTDNGEPKKEDANTDNSTGEPTPDTPDETDQRELFKKIVQEFKETQFDLMTAECDKVQEHTNNPDDINDAINDITDKYYQDLIDPYQDVADDNTKEKVRTIVEYNVKKQLKTPPGQGDGDDGNPDFDWGPKDGDPDNSDKKDSGEPTEPTEPTKPKDPNDNGKTWWDNTKDAWGLNGNPLYDYKPQGKTLGQLWHSRKQQRNEQKKYKAQKKQYDKDMEAYKKKKEAYDQKQAE